VNVPRPLLVAGLGAAVLAARALDLLTTLALTPDLAGERNVVLGAIGGGWPLLGGLNLFIAILVTGGFAAALRLQGRVRPHRRGLHYGPFLRWSLWGRFRPLADLWRQWPPRRRWAWAVGRLMPWVLIVASLAAAGGNLLALRVPAWRAPWALLVGGPARQALVLLAVAALTALAWSMAEYDLYRHAAAPPPTPAAHAGRPPF